jgi:vancomycin resistance protein YoaR
MKRKKAIIYWGIFGVIGVLVLCFGVLGFVTSYYKTRILPHVWINDVFVGNLDAVFSEAKVREQERERYTARIKLNIGGVLVAEPTFTEIGVSPQVKTAVTTAINFGKPRAGAIWLNESVSGFVNKKVPLQVLVYKPIFDKYLEDVLNGQIKTPQSANWVVDDSGKLQLTSSQSGELIDRRKLASDVLARYNAGDIAPVELTLLPTQPEVDDQQALELKPKVEKILASTFVLKAGVQTIEVPKANFAQLLLLERVDGKPVVTFSQNLLRDYLQSTIVSQVQKETRDASFAMENNRVTVFVPAQEGQELNVEGSIVTIRSAVESGQTEANLALSVSKSKVASTVDIDRLGITTLLSTGETNFRGSPVNRVHNIKVGAERFNGVLIPPGTTFAFNENLGPVGKATGYKPELVIKENVTTPEYGGGLCQVSTTAFRAAILSGLQIVERSNHAYPVAYYGAPGFDATIYPNQRTWKDGTDLKFVNDTPANILIQTRVEGTKLFFEFWGTSDGREVKIVGPTSYDRTASGSVKARLVQQVYKAGQMVREDIILSSYKSPALFPHVVAANAEKVVVAPTPTPLPLSTPKPKIVIPVKPVIIKTN